MPVSAVRWAVFACAVAFASSAGAATFVVDDTGTAVDGNPGDGVCDDGRSGICTLTAAIQEANALGGDDLIQVPAGTYDRVSPFSTGGDGSSQALPPITSGITISGAGAATTVVQRLGGTFRLLTVEPSGSLTLSGVTLGGGDAGAFDGGAVLVRGTLVLSSCGVYGNAGTAVVAEPGANVTVSGCTFAGNAGVNGGAIRGSFADVSITGSLLTANTSTNQGGAIWLEGNPATVLVVADTTVSGNGTVEAGGGVFATGDPRLRIERSTLSGNLGGDAGGGVAATGGVVRLANVTVSGNDAASGGGLAAFAGTPLFELASVTVTENQATAGSGGGLAGAARLRNTILAANGATTGGHDCSAAGQVVSDGYNVVGRETGCDWTSGTGDQVGTGATPLAPGLAALADAGGPTQTHALLATSPAGEAGNPAGCRDTDGLTLLATDQRGEARAQDGDSDGTPRCDVGAYEAPVGTFPTPSTTTSSSVTSTTGTTTSTTSTTTTTSSSTSSSTTTTTASTTSTSSSTTTTTVATTSTTTTTAPGFARACVGAGLFTTTSGPQTLVTRGVDDLTIASPRVVWQTFATCGLGEDSARVERIALQCGGVRTLFDANPQSRGGCVPYRTRSTVVADGTHVFWMDEVGLRRLSLDANVGDEPALLNVTLPQPLPSLRAQLVLHGGDRLVVAIPTGPSSSFPAGDFFLVDRQTGVATILGPRPVHPTDMDLSSDGALVYWRDWDDQLVELDVQKVLDGVTGAARVVATDVQSFVAEGTRLVCVTPTICLPFRHLFFASGPNVFRHDVTARTTDPTPVFTSTDPNALLTDLATTASHLFVFETRDASGGTATVRLMRAARAPGGVQQDLLHEWTGLTAANRPAELAAAKLPLGDFLYWRRRGQLQRLPASAETLPIADLRITGVEVTQAVQTIDESVPLIRDKDTWVRVHAASDGVPVAGVTALLYATWIDPLQPPGSGGPLVPVNPTGKYLTVQGAPNRGNVDHAFLFKLPKSWTQHAALQVHAVLNPNQYPPEPSYANNEAVDGPFLFQPSQRLEVQFVAWRYERTAFGTTTLYEPDYVDDVLETFRYIRQTYPLASTPGWRWTPGPGFRPGLQWVLDASLDERVLIEHPSCDVLYPKPKASDPPEVKKEKEALRPLCASHYTNTRMGAMRFDPCNGIFDASAWFACVAQQANLFYYGMISDGLRFPRGQACCAPKVSSGPVGPPASDSWDTDTTYGDWYAAHEIGHTLGRGHPSQGNWCGHSASDPGYPYFGAFIGYLFAAEAQQTAGFDGGGALFGISPTVYPVKVGRDFMSYCPDQWISDYTYEGMLGALGGSPGLAAARAGVVTRGLGAGDHLLVSGSITAALDAATLDAIALVPDAPPGIGPTVPGEWSITLRDGGGALLASHAFTPGDESTEAGLLTFQEAVPFVSGTALVALVAPGDVVLATAPVSANAPVVGGVGLVPAPAGPVTGTVTLGWSASDPDGEPLTASVYTSRDGGGTFQAVVIGLDGEEAAIDTDVLGGGETIFRVVVSDGVRSAQADSDPIEIATKAPVPLIAMPADGEYVGFGALVVLGGSAFDFQDDVVDDNLEWTIDGEPVGTGPEVEIEDLAVGAHVVGLSARNGAGLSAEASVTIVVVDDLTIPGPLPSVVPPRMDFHVPVGSTELQVETVELSNAGTGDLTWTAASDAGWLQVTPGSGAVPGTLTLVADPTGLEEGELRAAQVTVTVVGTFGEEEPFDAVVSVPVTIAAGDVLAAVSVTGGPSTTTTTLPTTTTTTLPVCQPPDCDDGDACTEDTCVADVGCDNTPLTGIGFARCLCGVTPDACAAETIPGGVVRKTAKACTALGAAETASGKRVRKLLGKAQRLLKKACRKAERAGGGRRPKLGAECATALSTLLCEQRERTITARGG